MWNERYSKNEYAYGVKPNEFLKDTLEKLELTGEMLFPAEGEGRNAVYAAKTGLNVSAFDISAEGRKKALNLAAKENVSVNYEVGSFFDLELVNHKFDAVALIYAHFPPPILSKYHHKIAELIKPKGFVILEGFSKGNLELKAKNPKVGGPGKIEMLFSVDSIRKDFPDFEIIQIEEVEIELNEGLYHNGRGKVIRFIGQKK